MIKSYTIQETIEYDKKDWSKNGKSGTLYNCGIKIDDNWFRGTLFDEKALARFQTFKAGDNVALDFEAREYNGKTYHNWKLPRESDLMSHRLDALEARVKALENK